MSLYPLEFEPIYKQKVWGGRTLEKLGRALPGDELIGESWEIADLGSTSPSGGGGGAARSRVANGPLSGRTLHELIESYGRSLIGTLPLNERGEFPLLFKYLDAHQNLSVQVHPSTAYAQRHDGAHLKSEAWYIVDADPGAAIYKGVREGVTAGDFRAAIEAGAVEQMMVKVPVKPGDCHYLPSGTCHALGTGVLAAEVQTASDTTFRVYDWGRTDRELHIDAAMECIDFGPPDISHNELDARFENDGVVVRSLVRCEYFRMEEWSAGSGVEVSMPAKHQPVVWMVIAGRGRIESRDFESVEFSRGRTLLLPAEMAAGVLRIGEPMRWLEVTFPQAMDRALA